MKGHFPDDTIGVYHRTDRANAAAVSEMHTTSVSARKTKEIAIEPDAKKIAAEPFYQLDMVKRLSITAK